MSRPLGTRMLMAVALMAVVLAGCEASSKHPVALSKWDRARAEATLAMAREQTAAGQFEPARQTLGMLKTDADPRVQIALARLDLEEGEFATAFDRLKPVEPVAGSNAEYHRLLAIALEATGKPAEAAVAYARAYQLQATPEVLVGWVDALAADGRVDEARTILEQERQRYPGDAALAVLAASLARASGDAPAAIRELTAAARAERGSAEIRQRLADAYAAAGQPGEAATLWRELAAGASDGAERQRCERQLADALAAGGQYDEAWRLYSRLLASRPDDERLRLRQAISGLFAGQVDDALVAARKVNEREPDNGCARLVAAVCYRRLGQAEAAAEQLSLVRGDDDLVTLAESLRSRWR